MQSLAADREDRFAAARKYALEWSAAMLDHRAAEMASAQLKKGAITRATRLILGSAAMLLSEAIFLEMRPAFCDVFTLAVRELVPKFAEDEASFVIHGTIKNGVVELRLDVRRPECMPPEFCPPTIVPAGS